MKRLILLSFVFILMLFSCSKDESSNIEQSFQLHGSSAEIPSLYFWTNQSKDPIIKGTANVEYELELACSSAVDADVTCVFHLCFLELGKTYKRDILKKEFKIKAGETIPLSGKTTFYGQIWDEASILVDVQTLSPSSLGSCPVTLNSSKVRILPRN